MWNIQKVLAFENISQLTLSFCCKILLRQSGILFCSALTMMKSSRPRWNSEAESNPSSQMVKGKQESSVSRTALIASNIILFSLLLVSLLIGNTLSKIECHHQALVSITTKTPERNCVVTFREKKMALCNHLNLEIGGNFGDELGPVVAERLLENLFGCSAQNLTKLNLKFDESKRVNESIVCLFSLGSVFHKVKKNDHIWGTGINPTWQGNYPATLNIYAVRGKLTEKLIRERMHYDKAVAYGDPGLAVPELFPELRVMRKISKARAKDNDPRFCFVPHAHDHSTAVRFLEKSILIIPVFQRWRAVLETLASKCDYVASTSLHGIVEADALGIPTLWFQWFNSSVSHTEGVFKYHDYFSTVGKSLSPVSNIGQVLNKSAYAKPLYKSTLNKAVNAIKGSFPYHLFQTSFEEVS